MPLTDLVANTTARAEDVLSGGVHPCVFGAIGQLQVLDPVVRLDAVDVVDDLLLREIPSKVLRHNGPVLENVPAAVRPQHDVTLAVVHASAFPVRRVYADAPRSASICRNETLTPAEFPADAVTAGDSRLERLRALGTGGGRKMVRLSFRATDAKGVVARPATEPGRSMVTPDFPRERNAAMGAGIGRRHTSNLMGAA